MLERLDFWLMVLTFGLLGYCEGRKRLWPVIRPLVRLAAGLFASSDQQSPPTVQRRRWPVRGSLGRFNGSVSAAETNRNKTENRFVPVSPIAMPKDDPEMVAFRFLARLVKAGHVTETQALETACEVRAGSSKAYQDARLKLKRALEELNKEERRVVLN